MNPKRSIGFEVKALSNQIKRLMEAKKSEMKNKLTGMQYGVIACVICQRDQRDVFQRDIEREFNIRRSTATGILQLMEKNNLIKRVAVSHDARLKKIVLTDKALEVHQLVSSDIQEMEDKITKGLTTEELELFHRTIEKMLENLK